MGPTALRSRIAPALAVLALCAGIATSAMADFDPDDLSDADRQLLINILEFEATNITRGLPASGASIVIVRTDTSPRICRYFRIRESDGDETAGVGCRSGQQLWDLAASEEDIPPADFAPPSATDIGGSAGRGPVLVEQGSGQYLGDPSDAEAAALEAAASQTGLDSGLPSIADFAPPMPPLRPETLAALPPPPAPQGPGERPPRSAETASLLVIEPAPAAIEAPAFVIAPEVETVSAPNGRIFRIPGPVPPRAAAPEPAEGPDEPTTAAVQPTTAAIPVEAPETSAQPSTPTEEPAVEEAAGLAEATLATVAVAPDVPLPQRRPQIALSAEPITPESPPQAQQEQPQEAPIEASTVSVEDIPAFVPLEVPAPSRRPGS